MSVSMLRASECARQGDQGFFDELTDRDWDLLLNAKDEDKRGLLHSAVGHPAIVDIIVSHGGGKGVNDADEDGWTCLISACSAGQAAVVRTLLDAGADVHAVNSTKRTALHYAASKGHEDVIRLLVQAGANMSAKDSLGATPLHRACSALQLNAVLALLEARAPTEVRDNEGNTALHVAIGVATTRTTAEIAFALVRAGASLDAANAAGFTAAALAGENLPELAAAAAAAGSADAPGGDSAMQDA